jgi:O-antigen/teichoic acid export membrane protein
MGLRTVAVMPQLAVHNLLLMLQYAIGSMVPLLLVPHVVRELGLETFGHLAVATALGGYAAAVVQYAFQITGPQQLAQRRPREAMSDLVLGIACAKLVLFAVSVPILLMLSLAWALFSEDVGAEHAMLLVGLPLAAALNTSWHLQTAGRYGTLLAISTIGVAVALAAGFVGLRPGSAESLWAATSLCVAPMVVGVSTLAVTLGMLEHKRFAWSSPWPQLRGGLSLFLSQMTSALYLSGGTIVIAALLDAQQAGAYGVIERVATAVIGGCLLVHTVAYPRLAQLYIVDRARYLSLVGAVIVGYLLLAAGASTLALLLEDRLAGFLFGHQAQESELLLRATLIWLMLGVFGPALVGHLVVAGRGREVLGLTLKILLVVLCVGIPGVLFAGAWAWMAALAVSQGVVLVVGWRAWQQERHALRFPLRIAADEAR